MMPRPFELMTIGKAAETLKVSSAEVRRLIQAGYLRVSIVNEPDPQVVLTPLLKTTTETVDVLGYCIGGGFLYLKFTEWDGTREVHGCRSCAYETRNNRIHRHKPHIFISDREAWRHRALLFADHVRSKDRDGSNYYDTFRTILQRSREQG